jgi:4-hydroxybenzoate polyprenyltransferase
VIAVPALVRGLVAACHPLPCLAVTAFVAGWGLSVGLPGGRVGLVALAVLLGQLSIGWCNDAVDAPRDRLAGRRDKPVPAGLVTPGVLSAAAGIAVLACVVASLALGVAAGVVHLVAVASGWAYDLVLKPTPISPLPYAVAFGLLPAVATLAASPAHWPPAGVLAGSALLGTGAHFANTVGDVEHDAATGVRGLPQRIGPEASLRVTAALVALSAVALLTTGAEARGWALALLVAGAALAVAGAALAGRMIGRGRAAFRLTLAAVALVVAGFLLSGAG